MDSPQKRLLLIRRELDVHCRAIENLRVEEEAILAGIFGLPFCRLEFDDDAKTVSWPGGGVCLGKKGWLFLKLLWEAKRHRMKTNRLGKFVWNDELIRDNTVSVFVSRLNEIMRRSACPVAIRSVIDGKTKTRIGFKLEKPDPRRRKAGGE